jgi:hypothetical protein
LSKESVKNILVVIHEVKENEKFKWLFVQFAASGHESVDTTLPLCLEMLAKY